MTEENFKKLLENGSQEVTVPPEFLNEVNKALNGSVSNDEFVAFWGSCFSNFFSTHFYLDKRYWTTSEKYFMYMKAITFGDEEIAEKILKTDNPKECKNLGRQVKNFNSEEWDKIKEEVMYKAVKAKFEQDGLCNFCILKYLYQEFVEGSPYDKIWGCGIVYNDERIFNKDNWKGENLLGKILTRVRNELFQSMYEE